MRAILGYCYPLLGGSWDLVTALAGLITLLIVSLTGLAWVTPVMSSVTSQFKSNEPPSKIDPDGVAMISAVAGQALMM